MFKIPRDNCVESDEGFSVEVLGVTGVEYKAGDKTLFVDAEVLQTGGIALFTRSIVTWKPPHDKRPISDAEKKVIISNIVEALAFKNLPVVIM